MAQLSIKNLGPIHELEIDVKQFNILIGEQATGKSIICKSIYFFREIRHILVDYLYGIVLDGYGETNSPKSLNKTIKEVFVQLFGYSWDQPDNLCMTYLYQDGVSLRVFLEKKNSKKYLSLDYSKKMRTEIRSYEQEAYANHELLQTLPDAGTSTFALNEKRRLHRLFETEVMNLLADDMETYYIPAGRSLMTLLSNQKTRFDYEQIDLVNRRFMQFIESIQPKFDTGISNIYRYYPVEKRKFDVHKMVKRLLNGMKGEYVFSKGQEYLQLPDHKERIPINYASSGQQEALWLLNQLYVLLLKNEKAFVIVEEPEAHVYPTLQREILEFIVQFMNFTGSTVLVTTHSPYILTCANGLYYGGLLMKRNAGLRKHVEAILGEETYIEPDKLMGLKLINTGQTTVAQTLIDNESGQMMPELIDEVSDTINRQYTSLFYLEEKIEDEDI